MCPFLEDERIDQAGLRAYLAELADVDGVTGLVVNGHTGEIGSLLDEERAAATAAAREAVGGKVKVVSGVMAEGSAGAVAQARAARQAGADGILLMPPHHWLRFGRSSETAVGFFRDVAEAVDVAIIVHQYPARTKAGYSLAEMLELVEIPAVVSIKMGTRDMARWGHDYRRLKQAAPRVSILSCEDENLLATLLAGADGALVGFAGFVPELIVELVSAALSGGLAAARAAEEKVHPLARIVYHFGEPSGDAHQRMKAARWLLGRFPSPRVRRPLRPLPADEIDRIRRELNEAGLETVR
jgi:4-hydroxy-tetrahydrodipicolinate synthase